VIASDPSPLDRVTGLNILSGGIKSVATRPDLHSHGRRVSEDGKEQGEEGKQLDWRPSAVFELHLRR